MNIVVTKNKVDYSNNFIKVSSLKEASEVVGTIDVLVYNNSNEDSETKISLLGVLKERVNKLIYICNEKNTDVAIKMMVIGSDGKYFDDEFFLESCDELSNLISSLDEITSLASLGGVNVVSDFFNRYLKEGSTAFNSNYLTVVKEAVNDMVREYNEKNSEILLMSETATDIFSSTSSLLVSMKKERESMKSLVEKMSNSVKETPVHSSRGSSVLFYPTVNYLKEKNIIRIKDIGGFKFLISFCLGFRLYLENIRNVRPKVIIIEPVGDMFEKLYSEYKWVKITTTKTLANYYNNVVFTNCPNREVLHKLLDDDKYDTFIVVDRTVSDSNHILNCKGGSVKYAVNSESCIEKFKLPKKDCFSSIVEISGTLFTVPVFPEYPVSRSARERLYLQELSSRYEKLILSRKGSR